MRARDVRACLATAAFASVDAFYLPGVAPSSYSLYDKVPVTVNTLSPSISRYDLQLHAVVSYDYYHEDLHFCQPEGGPQWVRESLGSIIFGDRIRTSPFELIMGKNELCKAICEGDEWDEKSTAFVIERIAQAYNVNLLVDGLPAAVQAEDLSSHERFTSPGFPLGNVTEEEGIVLHNHWDIIVDYHKAGITGSKYRVVNVVVEPRSLRGARYIGPEEGECSEDSGPLILTGAPGTKVQYTYSVSDSRQYTLYVY